MSSNNSDPSPESSDVKDQNINAIKSPIESSDHSNQFAIDESKEQTNTCESEQTEPAAMSTCNQTSPECSRKEIHPKNMVTAEASFSEATAIDLQPGATRSSVARILVKTGQIFRLQIDNEIKEVHGPATVRMISENRPDFPLPLHLPPGHVVQQVLDENGVLTHVIVSQTGPLLPPPPPLPHHHLHTGYSSSHYNGLYGPPHHYHTHMPYGPYISDALSYSSRNASNHGGSASNSSQTMYHHHSDNNGLSNSCNSTSVNMNASNHQHQHHHHRRRSPTYNNNSNLSASGTSYGRNLNSSGSKRRMNTGHGHVNSYVNNSTINGSNKSTHHPVHSLTSHYASFYPEMTVPTATDPMELSSVNQFETEQQTIDKNLLKLSPPTVDYIESRSALVRIQPPNQDSSQIDYSIDLSYLVYELLLSDKGKDAKYKQVYRGDAIEITLKDLKPATEYHLKICACIDNSTGDYTTPVAFKTECCEPDRPTPPKILGSRQRNSLNLKWMATADNGSKIINYILEYDEGTGREFIEIYRGTKKQYMLNKLNPSTFYSFRLAAENSIGRSEYSETVQINTLGTIPTEPDPPILVESGVKYLTVSWVKRPIDETFSLQMNDEPNYFRNKYSGPLTSYTITDLYRSTEYQFRLAAHNQSGQSNYSQIVTYRTMPDRPDPPAKPRIKGQIQATQCRIAWDPPREDGGAEIQQYHLECEETDGFHVIYNGLEREHLLEQLIPGHSYSLRLSCSNIAGQSDPSPVTQIKTPAVAPASCHPPRLSGKPKANSLHLRWTYPDYDGGSPVNEFEVQMINADNASRLVYRGRDLDCVVGGLSPGQSYRFQIRAFNRAGPGSWSEYLEVISGPGIPESPRNLFADCRSVNSAFISWDESAGNGASINEYRLEWSRKENESFMQLYCGPNCHYEAKGLSPMTHYFFRVQAVNTAGPSPYSILASCVTPAAPPSIVTGVKVQTKSTSMVVTWREPNNNGSMITGYQIDIGEKEIIFASADVNEYTIDEVLPDTAYRVRVRAVNNIGQGPYSSTVKCQTKCLPPDAPQLECTLTTCNSIKLRWNAINMLISSNPANTEPSSVRSITYIIEMKGKDGNFVSVYSGNLLSYKINKLQESTAYHFRICAKNDAGFGPWSSVYTFITTKAPPNALKAPHITEITSNSCVFHWQTHKLLGNDKIHYILQLQVYRRDNDYTEIYHGSCTSFRASNLQSGVDYRARVCALRIADDGSILNSPFSPATHFVLPRPEDLAASLSNSEGLDSRLTSSDRRETHFSLFHRSRSSIYRKLKSWMIFESRTLTDQQWAFVISVGFALLAIFIAIFANVIYSKYNNSSIDNNISSASS